MMKPIGAFATAGELARELGYTRNRLVRLLTALEHGDARTIFAVQLGSRRLYRRADVHRLLEP